MRWARPWAPSWRPFTGSISSCTTTAAILRVNYHHHLASIKRCIQLLTGPFTRQRGSVFGHIFTVPSMLQHSQWCKIVSTQGRLVKLRNMHLHGVIFLQPGIHFNLSHFHPVNRAFPTTGRYCIKCSLTNISHLIYSYRVWFNLRIIHTLVVSAHQLGQTRTKVVIYQGSELVVAVQVWHNTRPQRCTHHHRSASVLINPVVAQYPVG